MTRTLEQVDMDAIVSLCKRRGFIFPSSEIYGGLGSTWDYGPLGVELKRNVKDAWWQAVVHRRDDMVGLDAAILMHPQTWVASGHAETFADPLVECKSCNLRFREDHLWGLPIFDPNKKEFLGIVAYDSDVPVDPQDIPKEMEIWPEKLSSEHGYNGSYSAELPKRLRGFPITEQRCPNCQSKGSLTDPRNFNLMLKTFLGPVEDSASQVYLRPETAQGIFVNFQNVIIATRRKLPFGIAQIGKAFRNEITPGNFTFRTREFEQMEIEYFVKPGTDEEWHQRWLKDRLQWYIDLGIRKENLRIRQHAPDELAHYAKGCYDIEYRFPWGWAELEGLANRTDFDLRQHQEHSGQDLTYFDDQERYIPYVIEPSGGVDRAALAFLVDAYDEETVQGDTRAVLHLHPRLAPVKVAVLPLSRNARLVPKAREVYDLVRRHLVCQYDDAQSIGRRYRRQDEIGTPLAVTVDFQTIEQDSDNVGTVTIRDRDTMQQLRVPIPDLVNALKEKLNDSW